MTVPGRAVTVTGVVRPYVPGQRVLLQAFSGSRLVDQQLLSLKRSPQGVYGGFSVHVSSSVAGPVSVVVKHSASSKLTAFRLSQSFTALDPSVAPGAKGPLVQLVQQRLAALHFYIPQTGVTTSAPSSRVDAYHRLLRSWHLAAVGRARRSTDLLDGDGSFHGPLPEPGPARRGRSVDQLLALTDGSQVQLIFPISSGKPSTPTILGSFQIYERAPGYLPDGMYYSDFFIRGYAIHGYDPAPDYPASHGCMRLPIVDAIPAFNWLALGDWVDTYYTWNLRRCPSSTRITRPAGALLARAARARARDR